MGYSDVIDLLLEQHDEIRRLCAGVERSRGAERERRFAELAHLVHLHERGARVVVHPAVRNGTATADMVGVARTLEGAAIERSLVTLHDLGTRHPGFGSGFAALYRAILEHATREELDEFPILRVQVPVQRLHMMAGELNDVQVMDAA
ncbi:hemerythrin domain-containing protein [Actinoplanes oblitus]|uniref:Hemerythrin domain-containing protein n=1 Tax=Actinoplanes oblitus TaxID=3040509 RepID=A0ABY8WKC4_9ACTN|nr:hemerythrin domain-containing protein [Actinoplanes oblitus]WIM97310.1 hemerythrin domain-containing protein [Actinoplanes oblitus]